MRFLFLLFFLSSSFCHCYGQGSQFPNDPPNIVLIVADDMGYSDLGCFGSEIPTPNIDALANEGQIFSNFYTAATCSPTRAMLMTGVDHHIAGLGNMAERVWQIPEQHNKPGYEGYLNDRVTCFVELMRDAGYRTYMAGKWHLGTTPDQSPFAKGFQKSFSLLNAYANHFYPDPESEIFWEDNKYGTYPHGTYSSKIYTDKLIQYLEQGKNSEDPFFIYAAYTAPHWPLQAPEEMIRKYRGKYDMGYDILRERRFQGLKEKGIIPQHAELPPVPEIKGSLYSATTQSLHPWDSLSEREKQIDSRSMEIYAAMVDDLDQNIGRLIRYLKQIGDYDNTLFVFMSDNGAAVQEIKAVPEGFNLLDAMGKYYSFVAYGPQWAHAASAAFRLYKGYSAEGGIRTPLIVKMPRRNAGGEILNAFVSVKDLAPTFLELAGVDYEAIMQTRNSARIQGLSLLPVLNPPQAGKSNIERERTMGWELFGRRALRKGPWKITWVEAPLGTGEFELFNLDEDPGERFNLAAKNPKKYRELLAEWELYVKENGVILLNP